MILLVEDDPGQRRALADILGRRGYRVAAAASAAEALGMLDAERPDLAMVDLGLPDLDGIELSRHIGLRAGCPRIILTADDRGERIVEGLDSGADDYVLKPYDPDVLLARVRAALRRQSMVATQDAEPMMTCGDVTVDTAARTVFIGDDPTPAPIVARQFDLLVALVRNEGRVLTVADLSRALWGFDVPDDYRQALRNAVSKLRRSLGTGARRPRLETDHSVGYRLVGP
ncbi:MAG: response regulator transcription factor [Ilumatobacter sp.]|uniref:response regulator transcription factor n=2 Tax=Ilumatobacter sp. TaxID=1967498 RepID=UPI0032990F8D